MTPEEFDAEWNRRAVAWDRVIGLLDTRLLDLAEQVSLLDASVGALIRDYVAHKTDPGAHA